MSKKDSIKKQRLVKANRTNRRVPIFVTIRTNRKVVYNLKRRNWRTDKLGASKW